MKGSLKKLLTLVAKGQGGFALIKMILEVGIIAVLAAVIVLNMVSLLVTVKPTANIPNGGRLRLA